MNHSTEKKIAVVIPAFNEEKMIGTIIRETISQGFNEIVVVDDGSSDETSGVARSEGALVVRHAVNRGYGAALRTGLMTAILLEADMVATLDADGQHDPRDIKKVIAPILDEYDVSLGVRTFTAAHMPKAKMLYNFIAKIVIYILSGLLVQDSQCGLRAYSSHALNKITLDADAYAFSSEIIIQLKKKRLKFAEIPVRTIYTPYSRSKRHGLNLMNGIKTFYQLLFR